MPKIRWSELKSRRLKFLRGVSFEEIIHAELLGIENNPCRGDQKIFVVRYKGYVWAVPFVLEPDGVFLKTMYPSRKFKKIYYDRRKNEKNEII
ncbi:MAG: toxin [Candidatus Omnitrophica bacterium]|nr:toxin [Candidatus Omnitrophota bacterium]MDD5611001.1 toxin [Candidatus Omnitrophota bacterium]